MMAPRSTATTAVKAPPTSTETNEVSEYGIPRRRAWSHTASATAQSLSAVPMSMRFALRCSGTVVRCSTPGAKQTGRPLSLERPSTRPMPPTMVPRGPSAASASNMSSSSSAPTSRTSVHGRP